MRWIKLNTFLTPQHSFRVLTAELMAKQFFVKWYNHRKDSKNIGLFIYGILFNDLQTWLLEEFFENVLLGSIWCYLQELFTSNFVQHQVSDFTGLDINVEIIFWRNNLYFLLHFQEKKIILHYHPLNCGNAPLSLMHKRKEETNFKA